MLCRDRVWNLLWEYRVGLNFPLWVLNSIVNRGKETVRYIRRTKTWDITPIQHHEDIRDDSVHQLSGPLPYGWDIFGLGLLGTRNKIKLVLRLLEDCQKVYYVSLALNLVGK